MTGLNAWWCCCKSGCWTFLDQFNRDASTDVGANWNEATGVANGDWDILDTRLHEKYGGGGTADAIILCTQAEPVASAGQMMVSVKIINANEGDVFRIYPCCTDSETLGPITVEFTKLASGYWRVDIISGAGTEATATQLATDLSGTTFAWVCAWHKGGDPAGGAVMASMAFSSGDGPAWDSDLDPGAGRYAALGHDNATNGAYFDDFFMGELFLADGTICTQCWCMCCTTLPKKQYLLTITDASGRATCLGGETTLLDYTWATGEWPWVGDLTVNNGFGDNLWDFTLKCSGIDDPDCVAANWPLTIISNCASVGTVCGGAGCTVYPDPELSSCVPLNLVYGPFSYTFGMLACNACYATSTMDPITGEYWIVITEP